MREELIIKQRSGIIDYSALKTVDERGVGLDN